MRFARNLTRILIAENKDGYSLDECLPGGTFSTVEILFEYLPSVLTKT